MGFPKISFGLSRAMREADRKTEGLGSMDRSGSPGGDLGPDGLKLPTYEGRRSGKVPVSETGLAVSELVDFCYKNDTSSMHYNGRNPFDGMTPKHQTEALKILRKEYPSIAGDLQSVAERDCGAVCIEGSFVHTPDHGEAFGQQRTIGQSVAKLFGLRDYGKLISTDGESKRRR